MYCFVGKPGKMYELEEVVMKLNYNCPNNEKIGEGPGSCGGSTSKQKNFYELTDAFDNLLGNSHPSISQLTSLQQQFVNFISSNKDDELNRKANRFLDILNKKIGLPKEKVLQKPKNTDNKIHIDDKSLATVVPNVRVLDSNNLLDDRAKNVETFDKISSNIEKSLIEYNDTHQIKNNINDIKNYAINADSLDMMDPNVLEGMGDINEYDLNVNYSLMNAFARRVQDGKTTWDKAPENMRTAYKNIYNILEKSIIPKDIIVYRGIDMTTQKQYADNISKPGAINISGTFLSTSLNPATAETYAFPDTKNNQVIEIISVPKGTKGRFLDKHISLTQEEKEVLLQANTKYKTSHITKKDGITFIFRKVIDKTSEK
jgi:hypothetical protein